MMAMMGMEVDMGMEEEPLGKGMTTGTGTGVPMDGNNGSIGPRIGTGKSTNGGRRRSRSPRGGGGRSGPGKGCTDLPAAAWVAVTGLPAADPAAAHLCKRVAGAAAGVPHHWPDPQAAPGAVAGVHHL